MGAVRIAPAGIRGLTPPRNFTILAEPQCPRE